MSEDVLTLQLLGMQKKYILFYVKKTDKEIKINYPFSEEKILKQTI